MKHVIKKCLDVISIAIFIAVFAYAIMYSAYYYRMSRQDKLHIEITEYIQQSEHLSRDDIDQEYDRMMKWIENGYVSDADRGKLYECLSNIYLIKGDTMGFYQCLGNALYYLDETDQVNTSAKIYADLANYYVCNNCYERAQEMIDQVYNQYNLVLLDDLKTRSYMYRMQAVIFKHDQKYDLAIKMIDLSEQCVYQIDDLDEARLYHAKNDVIAGSIAFELREFDKVKSVLDRYANSPYFSQVEYRDTLVKDFIIPYYMLKLKMMAYNHELEGNPALNSFCNYCEKYNYHKLELVTLNGLAKSYGEKVEEKDSVSKKIDGLYLNVTNIQSEEYALLIASQLDKGMTEMRNKNETKHANETRNQRMAAITSIIAFLVTMILISVYYGHKDALTRVKNRKALNRSLRLRNWMKKNYTAIMIDIDNFKKVNDTYGHGEGDIVLKKLGAILKSVKQKGVKVYRYGGEEFTVIVDERYKGRAVGLAEYIREQVELSDWDYGQMVTLSLGVSKEGHSCDLVEDADENLYYSKKNGKNVVTYWDQEERTMYQK